MDTPVKRYMEFMEESMSFFSEQLQKYRKKNNLTQQELASLLGINRVSYARWESGAREPSLDTVVKLAQILNTTTDELLGQTVYSKLDIYPHPLERIDLTNLKNFTKNEYDDLKQAIVLQQIKGSIPAYKLKNDIIHDNKLDKEETEIINTIFIEIQNYWNMP